MPTPQEPHRARQHRTHTDEEEAEVNAEEAPAETSREVAVREDTATKEEEPVADPWKTVYGPYDLPANTAVAQQMITNGINLDESVLPGEDALAAAKNEIELYGHPEDPRIAGGSLLDDPLTLEQLAAPPARQIDPLPPADPFPHETLLQRAAREEAEKEEARA